VITDYAWEGGREIQGENLQYNVQLQSTIIFSYKCDPEIN